MSRNWLSDNPENKCDRFSASRVVFDSNIRIHYNPG